MHYRGLSLSLLAFAVVVYVAALAQDEVFCVAGKCDDWPGYMVLLLGILATGDDPGSMAWFANPAVFIAWITILMGRRIPAVVLSGAALALAAAFMLAKTIVTNEGGIANPVTGLRLGYWLWLSSLAITCLAAATATRSGSTQ
jgi:hypothetical protein